MYFASYREVTVERLKVLILASFAVLWLFSTMPALGHGCGHHGGCGSDCDGHGCYGCGSWSGPARWANPPARSAEGRTGVTGSNTQSYEGKVAEVIYLPGVTAETAMVELRLQAGSETIPVRLGPAGFLKHNQLNLKEGDAITVLGYRVSTGDGDLLVATEVGKQGKNVRLRDRWGRPAW
jgi:hypothetical protein